MELQTLGAWQPLLQAELRAPYFEALCERVDAARNTAEIYPPAGQEFFCSAHDRAGAGSCGDSRAGPLS